MPSIRKSLLRRFVRPSLRSRRVLAAGCVSRRPAYIFGIWGSIAALSGIAALLGYVVFARFTPSIVSGTIAVAAGAILTMLVDTMIPEAFEKAHDLAGLITVLGFLLSSVLSKTAG